MAGDFNTPLSPWTDYLDPKQKGTGIKWHIWSCLCLWFFLFYAYDPKICFLVLYQSSCIFLWYVFFNSSFLSLRSIISILCSVWSILLVRLSPEFSHWFFSILSSFLVEFSSIILSLLNSVFRSWIVLIQLMFVFSWPIFHMLSTDFGLEERGARPRSPHTLQHSSTSTAFTLTQADPALWTLVMLSLLTLNCSHPFLPLWSHHWICEGFTYQFFIPDLQSWKIEQDKGGVHFTLQYIAQS